jgi:site-specific DNA-methyltransferase (adenine-specific)/modification methylase
LKSKKNGDLKQMRDFWQMSLVQGKECIRNSDGKALHPTQKLEEILKRIILASSNEGDIALDPFFGSGTADYVTKIYNRRWVGIKKDKNYLKMSKNRLCANP